MSENKAVLYKKMAQVMGQLKRVKETGKHQVQKWSYATSEDVKDAVRAAMADAGLALLVSLEEHEIIPLKDKGILLRGKMAFTLCCGETGATETRYLWGEAADQAFVSDKAFYKLYTTLEKYFLKTTFLISSGEDVAMDSDADDNRGAVPAVIQRGQSDPEDAPPPPSELSIFMDRVLHNLKLTYGETKDILKEMGYKGFKPAEADIIYDVLAEQMVNPTTPTAFLVLANRETDAYYRSTIHLSNAVGKLNLGLDFPPSVDRPLDIQTILAALIEYGNAGNDAGK